MRIKELLHAMFHAYFVITTGVTMSMYVSCLLFKPEAELSPVDIGGILLLALISDLSFLLFCSRRELGRRQMMIRISVHIPILVAILVYFADIWNWINIRNPIEVFVFILLVFCVYVCVLAVTFFQDKKTADQLNDGLKKRYHS